MFFRVMLFVRQFVLDLIAVMRLTDDEKDLEVVLLRQQLRIVERKQARGPHIPRWQKCTSSKLFGQKRREDKRESPQHLE